ALRTASLRKARAIHAVPAGSGSLLAGRPGARWRGVAEAQPGTTWRYELTGSWLPEPNSARSHNRSVEGDWRHSKTREVRAQMLERVTMLATVRSRLSRGRRRDSV